MSRFLFVVPPFAGHINPTVAVGRQLQRRGHEVAWSGHPALTPALLPRDCRLLGAGGSLSAGDMAEVRGRWLNLRAFAALKALWEEVLIPLAVAMVDGVEEAADHFCPDVVVADQQAFAGALVARRRQLPWATSASTFSELARPYASIPRVEAWVDGLLTGFQEACGVSPAESRRGDLRFSAQLVLAFTTPELAGPVEAACSPVFVGPAIGERPPAPLFPWTWLDRGPSRRRRVLASLGTHSAEAGSRFYRVLSEAAGARREELQVVVAARAGSTGAAPDNVLVRSPVPQLELLKAVDAVVTHGGYNTVSESLAHGVPMVVAPIRDDQPLIAERIGATGAGIQVRFARVNAGDLGAAMDEVLGDPAYRAAAVRIGDGFAAAGGAVAAADHLEKLA